MRLLLDENVSPRLAEALRRAGLDAVAIQGWRSGSFMAAPDEELLAAAAEDGRILLTADEQTIRPLLRSWAMSDRLHSGVLFLRGDETAEPRIGDLVRRIVSLDTTLGEADWTNRAMYLPR
jgi:hypothetical protein